MFHGLRPVDEECRANVTTEKSGKVHLKLKDDNGTHLEHRSTAKARQTIGLPLLPCPRVPLLQPDTPVPSQD